MVVKRAVVEWLSAEAGGRKAPPPGPQYVAPAKFLSHADGWEEQVWSLVVSKVGGSDSPARWLADVHFWAEDGPHEWLSPGGRFELYEGRRCVAIGQIEPAV